MKVSLKTLDSPSTFPSLLAFVALSLLSFPAQAGLSDVAVWLKGPVGKYFLSETAEGLFMSERLVGHAVGTRATADEVIAQLARGESKALLSTFEERMYGIDERLKVTFAARESASLEAGSLLRQIAAQELPFQAQAGRALVLGQPQRPASYEAAREAFMAAEQPPTLALSRLKGRVFEPGAKLGGADLRFSDLSSVKAPYASMQGTRLDHAFLKEADLRGANLQGAELLGADLRGAKLKDAQLSGANLQGADLRGAHLNGADLSQADLRGANLSTAAADTPYFGIRKGADVKLDGTIIDASTKLPGSWGTRAELEARGVIFVD